MTVVNTVQNMDWRELARRVRDEVGQIDALIVDAPYSARTHSGHDGRVDAARSADDANRREISYRPWAEADVSEFVSTWSPLVAGWFVSITDSTLAMAWERAMEASGRAGFAPLPLVETGATVRLSGDGPSSWTTWGVVSRPRTRPFSTWGTLPGWYSVPREKKPVAGGKPLALMESLVRDYTKPGDLVCDPCCGGGTTLLAAKLLGRRYVGSDIDAGHVEIARERLRAHPTKPKAGTLALPWETE